MSNFSKDTKKVINKNNEIRISNIRFFTIEGVFDFRSKAGSQRAFVLYPEGDPQAPGISVVFFFGEDFGSRREYFFRLETTRCNLGGMRYWFICEGYTGEACGRRVAILYIERGVVACRHCHRLTYESRNVNRKDWMFRAMYKILVLNRRVDKLEKEIKREYYGGRRTKKSVQRYQCIKKSLWLQGVDVDV